MDPVAPSAPANAGHFRRKRLTRTAVPLLLVACGLVFAFQYPRPQARAAEVSARPTSAFLDSIGVVSSGTDRGQALSETIRMLRYGGFRWLRGGIEGLSDTGVATIDTVLTINKETGVKISWGLGSGSSDIDMLLRTGRVLAEAGALLSFEGNNEPNNWPVTYNGEVGGGGRSWMAVAKVQSDLYKAVKSDPLLAAYPVWSVSETGAETDDVGLQYLQIPEGAHSLMPDGTRFADYANVHNYIYHPHAPDPDDNKSWDAADPSSNSPVDGLYGNAGRTWAHHYPGYDTAALAQLPRVTTETGVSISGPVDEKLQAANLLDMYLDQFARGYAYTGVYILRDRVDEAGVQTYGFFRPDYSPRESARDLHNLTEILADGGTKLSPGRLDYTLTPQSHTVHDLLLQRSDGVYQLVVWGELLSGAQTVTVHFKENAAHADIFDPTIGTSALSKETNANDIVLSLSDHPMIINLY